MNRLTMKGPGTSELMKAVDKLWKSEVLIGIPDANADRQPDPEDPVPITNAGIGFVGRIGDKPLIDTGQLRNAVSYVVRPATNQGG